MSNRKSAVHGAAGGLSGLVGSARGAGGNFSRVLNGAASQFGDNNVASGEPTGLVLNTSAEPTPGGALLFPGGRTIGEREIEASPRFSSEVRAAWGRSNPNGPKDERREVGFFATVTGGDRPGVLYFRFSGYNEGRPGEHYVNMGKAPRPPERSVVIDFHTHPFGINSGPSDEDYGHLDSYATGVTYSFGGYYWYGKVIP